MKQDLISPVSGQFHKIYIQRHENVRYDEDGLELLINDEGLACPHILQGRARFRDDACFVDKLPFLKFGIKGVAFHSLVGKGERNVAGG